MSELPSCTPRRTGLASIETWLIILLLVVSGGAIGYPVGHYFGQKQSAGQVQQVRIAYAEASATKDALVNQCLLKSTEAVEQAGEAVEAATKAAEE